MTVNKKNKVRTNWLISFLIYLCPSAIGTIIFIFIRGIKEGYYSSELTSALLHCGPIINVIKGVTFGFGFSLTIFMVIIFFAGTTYICAYEEKGIKWLLLIIIFFLPSSILTHLRTLIIHPNGVVAPLVNLMVVIYFWISCLLLLRENWILRKSLKPKRFFKK